MSARWPSCSQPIVGTRPTGRATSASAARSSARVRTTRSVMTGCDALGSRRAEPRAELQRSRSSGMPAESAPTPGAGPIGAAAQRLVEHGVVHADGLRLARERAGHDVRGVGTGRGRRSSSRRSAYGRAWRGSEVAEAEQVGDDLDLAAAAGAGADADRRDAQALGDGRGELRRDELEHDREGARLLDRERVGQQGPGLVAVLALDPDLAAHAVLAPAASSRCGP